MKPHIHATGLFLIHQQTFLILRRNPQVPQGDQWALVGGKVASDELPLQTIVQKTQQEIGLKLQPDQFSLLDQFELTYPENDITFHVFGAHIDQQYQPELDTDGNIEHRWVTRDQCLRLPNVMSGLQIILHSPAIKQALQATA